MGKGNWERADVVKWVVYRNYDIFVTFISLSLRQLMLIVIVLMAVD